MKHHFKIAIHQFIVVSYIEIENDNLISDIKRYNLQNKTIIHCNKCVMLIYIEKLYIIRWRRMWQFLVK